MHKLTFSLLLLYAFPFSLVAQHDSIPIGKVTYKHLVNIPADEDKNGAATLLFNRAYSVYIHNDAPKAAASSRTSGYVIKNVSGDSEGFPIFKKHRERQILYKTGCFLSKSHCII